MALPNQAGSCRAVVAKPGATCTGRQSARLRRYFTVNVFIADALTV
jgi:hypothetical protein